MPGLSRSLIASFFVVSTANLAWAEDIQISSPMDQLADRLTFEVTDKTNALPAQPIASARRALALGPDLIVYASSFQSLPLATANTSPRKESLRSSEPKGPRALNWTMDVALKALANDAISTDTVATAVGKMALSLEAPLGHKELLRKHFVKAPSDLDEIILTRFQSDVEAPMVDPILPDAMPEFHKRGMTGRWSVSSASSPNDQSLQLFDFGDWVGGSLDGGMIVGHKSGPGTLNALWLLPAQAEQQKQIARLKMSFSELGLNVSSLEDGDWSTIGHGTSYPNDIYPALFDAFTQIASIQPHSVADYLDPSGLPFIKSTQYISASARSPYCLTHFGPFTVVDMADDGLAITQNKSIFSHSMNALHVSVAENSKTATDTTLDFSADLLDLNIRVKLTNGESVWLPTHTLGNDCAAHEVSGWDEIFKSDWERSLEAIDGSLNYSGIVAIPAIRPSPNSRKAELVEQPGIEETEIDALLAQTQSDADVLTQDFEPFGAVEQLAQYTGWHPRVPAFVTLLPGADEPWIEQDNETFSALLGGGMMSLGAQVDILDGRAPSTPRRRPVQGNYSRNSFPDAAERTPLVSLWEWRGLMMGLSTQGGATTFVFAQDASNYRVEEADVIFQGVDARGRADVIGLGVMFTRCGRYSVPMEGFIGSGATRVTLRGVGPVLGERCKVVGERPYSMTLKRISGTSTTLWREREEEEEEEDQ